KRLAERVSGKDLSQEVFKLPIYNSALTYPHFLHLFRSEALAPFRRLGQRLLYKRYWWQDEM
ncbi:MAG: FAD-dependent oxidoreductase, partial [Burkholderiaceae bacterium]